MASKLFSPFKLRSVEFRNRIFVSPMCQYSGDGEGMPMDWHFVHLGSRAVGGAGLVMTEATAVSPEGRISKDDLGIWNDSQAAAFKRIASFIEAQGAVPGIQLAHAGRKASTALPWEGGGPVLSPSVGAWTPVAPSAVKFAEGHCLPLELSLKEIDRVSENFLEAAVRALKAGFKVAELHMAHGYLLHEFLSPISNKRSDSYGGPFENRTRLPLQIAKAVREFWPKDLPVFVRISATDWVDGGWDLPQAIEFSKALGKLGIDFIDCSSGGMTPDAKIPAGVGFQTPFAAMIRYEAKIATGAVGLILNPSQAEHIIVCGEADAVSLGREELRDPYWPLHAAKVLHADVKWPKQYERGKD